MQNKLTLNLNKTNYSNYLLFHPVKEKQSHHFLLNFDGNMLMQTNESKYLGVLDAKLNWKAHILHLTSSVAQSFGVLCKIRHFLSKNLLKMPCNTFIKSKLSYAITLWASAYKSDLHKLNVLNNLAVCCITFANRHTNLNTLYKKHKILKLNELQHYKLGKHMFKLHNKETPLLLIGNYQLVRDRHNYNTRHSPKDNYVIPLRHRKQDQNSFMYLEH